MSEEQEFSEACGSDTRTPLPQHIRLAALAACGTRCQRCATEKDAELHHIWPVGRKGPHTVENLSVLCKHCHIEWHRHVENPKFTDAEEHLHRDLFFRYLRMPKASFLLEFAERNPDKTLRDAILHHDAVKERAASTRLLTDQEMIDSYVERLLSPDTGGALGSLSRDGKARAKQRRAAEPAPEKPAPKPRKRRTKMTDKKAALARQMVIRDRTPVPDVAIALGVSKASVYLHTKRARRRAKTIQSRKSS